MTDFEQVESSSQDPDHNLSSRKKKMRKRSKVWNWFTEEIIDEIAYAVCTCGQKFKIGNKNGTTTLKHHMESRCKNRSKQVVVAQDDPETSPPLEETHKFIKVQGSHFVGLVTHVHENGVDGLTDEQAAMVRDLNRTIIVVGSVNELNYTVGLQGLGWCRHIEFDETLTPQLQLELMKHAVFKLNMRVGRVFAPSVACEAAAENPKNAAVHAISAALNTIAQNLPAALQVPPSA